MNPIPFGGTVPKAAVRSAIVAATNAWFLQNIGTAHSTFNSSHLFDVGIVQHLGDGILFSNSYGAAGGDLINYWDGTSFVFNPALAGADDVEFQFTADTRSRFVLTGPNFGTTGLGGNEFNLGFDRFSFGQVGSVGNQVGVFVAPTRTTDIAGDWSDFLLTQAGSITVDDAIGTLAGWTINAPSIILGTGSLTDSTALLVGGNPGVATGDRTGVRIISNPSGGGGVNAALYVTAGLSRFDGRVDINNGIALGGGAAATLGTIGGSGPTAAAQAQWVEIDIGGTAHWIPAWT